MKFLYKPLFRIVFGALGPPFGPRSPQNLQPNWLDIHPSSHLNYCLPSTGLWNSDSQVRPGKGDLFILSKCILSVALNEV